MSRRPSSWQLAALAAALAVAVAPTASATPLLVADADGAGGDGTIVAIDTDDPVPHVVASAPLHEPVDLVQDDDATVVVLDVGPDGGTLYRVSLADGTATPIYIDAALSDATGIAVDEAGAFRVTYRDAENGAQLMRVARVDGEWTGTVESGGRFDQAFNDVVIPPGEPPLLLGVDGES